MSLLRRWYGYAVGGAVLLVLSAAHSRVRASGFDQRGPLLVLDHLHVIAVVCVLLWLCAAVGSWGLSRWDTGLRDALERLHALVADEIDGDVAARRRLVVEAVVR